MTEVLREAPAIPTIADRPLRVVGVSGSLHEPSRTTALVRTILASVAQRIPAETELVEVAALGAGFAGALAGIDVVVYPGSWSQWSRSRGRLAAVGPAPSLDVVPV